ncbi:6-aminohexanoate hydrolase [Thioclava nitratireducens]|uniref:6-aminohexanoate hydrolase n=1 Tax=Thioclava nitratireducens TaxID=1915078 RepID=A0ABN4XG86_9RHOB|nr:MULTISPECIES: serine hydrolase [Thioclava]AQS49162.1 6-aminohexanoate hydrolase [Thioclava nitratireducens]PWE51591.1 6-aminohexanoate hydrolase [Thioclava sp. NG1]
MRGWKAVLGGIGLLVMAAVIYAIIVPPELLRVGAGYSAKITCSALVLQDRDPDEVLETDVQAPGNPLLRAFWVSPDRRAGRVWAAFAGIIAPTTAEQRMGLGCATFPDGDLADAREQAAPPAPGPSKSVALWPAGSKTELTGQGRFADVLQNDALTGPGMRAVVVIKDGQLVAERYGDGFDAKTPLLGWSMTKTVTAALVGTAIEAGKLRMDQSDLLPEWQGDDRAKITVAQLMSMSSGLHFNEDYGDVSDVTRMLYLEPDMAKFAASQPLDHPPGTHFSYSSGTAVLLSRIWQNAVGDTSTALAWPRRKLFGPLGMNSATLETDASGTFVGSSYLYATARDWARFGQFLLQDGQWEGRQLLSAAFVKRMHAPAPTDGVYAQGMIWLAGPSDQQKAGDDARFGLPADTYWLEGHDGQTVTVIPSADMVVVRMGLTPSDLNYRPQKLVAALLEAAKTTTQASSNIPSNSAEDR